MSPPSSYEYRQEQGVFAGVTYTYRVAPPTPTLPPPSGSAASVSISASASVKWALLQHGFPAGIHSWRFVVPLLVSKGYHVVVPDMLGYGGTDKPLDVGEYKGKKMCESLIGIMDKEGAGKFISVGHDWGTYPATRMALWYPDRVSGVVLAAVGYTPPGPAMNLDNITAMITPLYGYDPLSYWRFFTSEDAGDVVDKHIDTFVNILFARNQPDDWKTYIADHVELRKALEEDKQVARAAYTTDEDFDIYKKELSDGASAARFNWYKSVLSGQNWPEEQELAIIKNQETIHLKMPVLHVSGALDALYHPALQKGPAVVHLEDLTSELVIADHWIMESKPEEFNAILGKWIDEKIKA